MSSASTTSVFMPPAVTEVAKNVDTLYGFLLIASLISCILVIGGLIYFAMKYRRQGDNDKVPYISHNTALEFLWSFIPFVIFMVAFVWGWVVYYQLRTFPVDSMEVMVNAQKWNWVFTYKNGRKSPALLTVPVNQNVKLIMTSKDVLHSFFIPAFRNKQDVVPGRYTAVWFNAEKLGSYQVFCAEYCGDNHAGMLAKIDVVTRAEFDQWLSTEPYKGLAPAQIGQKIYSTSCIACHGLAPGEKKTGPTFAGIFGKTEELEGGGTVTVDENYIRESMMLPNAKIVKGFQGVMPTQSGQLDDEEVAGVIEYLKTLK